MPNFVFYINKMLPNCHNRPFEQSTAVTEVLFCAWTLAELGLWILKYHLYLFPVNIFHCLKLSDLSDLNFVTTPISQLTLCFSDLTLSDITGRQTAACVGNDLLSFPWLFFLAHFSEAKQLSDLGLCEFDQHQYINTFGLQETMVPEPTHATSATAKEERDRSVRLQMCFVKKSFLTVCWFFKANINLASV